MLRKIIFIAVALSCVICSYAQGVEDGGAYAMEGGTFVEEFPTARPTFELRKHEFAVGGAFYPGHNMTDFMYFPSGDASPMSVSDYNNFSSLYDITYSTTKVSNSWWLSYAYNFTELFAAQILFEYDGVYETYRRRRDDVVTSRTTDNYYTAMLGFRCCWLNRPIVRMYSSVGVGITYLQDNYTSYNYIPSVNQHWTKFAFHVTPVGISIGKKVFGFAELGVGTLYIGGCAGIGYRF